MIRLTRLDGNEFILNCDLIEFFESTPDTVITLVTGKKIIVKQSVDSVYKMIVAYKQSVHNRPLFREGKRVRVIPEDDQPFLFDKRYKDADELKSVYENDESSEDDKEDIF